MPDATTVLTTEELPPLRDVAAHAEADAFEALFGVPDLPLARTWMEEQLFAHGVRVDVINAMRVVPRHVFAGAQWFVSYLDLELRLGRAWLPAPSLVARMVSAVPSVPQPRVLDLGTGTGYQAAVLSALGAWVVSVDSNPDCLDAAQERLAKLQLGARFVHGEPIAQVPPEAGYDAIIINGALSQLPARLFDLLGDGGVIVAPLIVADGTQRLVRYAVSHEHGITALDLGPCRTGRSFDRLR